MYTVYRHEGANQSSVTIMVGYKVSSQEAVPDGLQSLQVPEGTYQLFLARGAMPEIRTQAWQQIDNGLARRAYTFDFEIYGPKAQNGLLSELEIYVSTLEAEPQQA